MRTWTRRLWLALLLVLGSGPLHAGTVLVVEGGVLTGARGVNVGGVHYDVSFVEGDCVAVHGGTCGGSSAVFWGQSELARMAAQALLDQVFVGDFDTTPSLTAGCSADVCSAATLWAQEGEPLGSPTPFLNAVIDAENFGGAVEDSVRSAWLGPDENTAQQAGRVWAVWRIAEPAAVWSVVLGLVGLAAVSHRRGRAR